MYNYIYVCVYYIYTYSNIYIYIYIYIYISYICILILNAFILLSPYVKLTKRHFSNDALANLQRTDSRFVKIEI